MEAKRKWPDDASLAYALLRVTLGLNIFIHGVSRLLSGVGNFVAAMIKMFQNTILPTAAVVPFAYALPWLETTIGLLIIVGFRTRAALVSGALLLLALTFGTTLRQDWDVAAIQLLYSVVYAILIAALRYNGLSVDDRAFTRASRAESTPPPRL
jgi:thiosulfate dehydrogenase (quinone) large subunit